MLDRGLVRTKTNPMGRPAAFFAEAGLNGLRQLLQGWQGFGRPEKHDGRKEKWKRRMARVGG
jgi:hypothetical protein